MDIKKKIINIIYCSDPPPPSYPSILLCQNIIPKFQRKYFCPTGNLFTANKLLNIFVFEIVVFTFGESKIAPIFDDSIYSRRKLNLIRNFGDHKYVNSWKFTNA